MIRFGVIVRSVITKTGVYPEIWTDNGWQPGGDLRCVIHGRVLSRKELAAHGIPFDPDTVDQQHIRRHGWVRSNEDVAPDPSS
jgi:hypothetical protein